MKRIKGLNILVTGATGFIGSHLAERLLAEKPENIVCIYRENNPKSYFQTKKISEKVTLASCDIKDFRRILDVMTKYEIDIVFHLAAQAIVGIAYRNPKETLESNILGTANILEACRMKGDLKAIVVASSDKAYGKTTDLPYDEQTPLAGDHPYDVSKSAADLISQAYFKTYSLPATVARFGNVFGPGDLNFNRIMPGIFKAIIEKRNLLVRSDGKMIREYIYVKDVVDGYLKLAQNINKTKGEAFNFGSKNIFSVLEVIKKIEQILKIKVKYKILNIAKNEIPKQYLNWTKAKKMLEWQPQTNFQTGIKESFKWYRAFYF